MQKKLGIIDTHAHLCDPAFGTNLDQVLSKASRAGVSAVITVSENISDAKRNIELAEKHPQLFPAAGLYPTSLDFDLAAAMHQFIRKERAKLVAIGEVGLDHWAVKEDPEKEIQHEIFRGFIDLARELNLPINIHSRSAGRHAIALLLEKNAQKVQLHAFDGKAASALPAIEAGFYFSIPPSVIRSRQKQKLVKRLPLSSILIETDSPVLGPIPGERNESINALISVKAIAEIKGISKNEVVEKAFYNTKRLYGDLKP